MYDRTLMLNSIGTTGSYGGCNLMRLLKEPSTHTAHYLGDESRWRGVVTYTGRQVSEDVDTRQNGGKHPQSQHEKRR